MKKILLVALVAVFAISCSKSPVDQALKLIEETQAKVEKVTSAEELQKIGDEFKTKLDELTKDMKPEDMAKVDEAIEKMNEATKDITEKFAPAEEPAPETEGEEVKGDEAKPEEANAEAKPEEAKPEGEAAPAEGEAAPAEPAK